ncbi:MAG: hypothetical protein OXD36_10780 [Rhodobacter sp.]|nr:hypothetical protein [Rhodobacter sp.]MCY4242213.1 hypothetical protein [Rhodobacter sp.]
MRHKPGRPRNRAAELARAVAAAGRLREEIGTLDAERQALRARRSETPKRVTVAQLDKNRRPEALPSRERAARDRPDDRLSR